MKLEKKLLVEALVDIEKIWDKELRSLMSAPPEFKDIKKITEMNL